MKLLTPILLIILMFGCAKELPLDISKDIERNVYKKSEFTNLKVKKINGNLSIVQGSSSLQKIFYDYNFQNSLEGEIYNIELKVTRKNLIVYVLKDQHKFNVNLERLAKNNRIPLFQFEIKEFGKLIKDTNIYGKETNSIILDETNFENSTHLKINLAKNQRVLIPESILLDKSFIDRNVFNVKNKEFIYVPMTKNAPREVMETKAFNQGGEKIVKFKWEKNGLAAYQEDRDPRFKENETNKHPVIFIPGEYVDYSCQNDLHGNCLKYDGENKKISWKEKRYFVPRLSGIVQHEFNMLDFDKVDNSCVTEVSAPSQVLFQSEKNALNIELKRNYKIAPSWNCLKKFFFKDRESYTGLESMGFNVNVHFSFIELSSIASKDYKTIDYPVYDQEKFGFFKSHESKLDTGFNDNKLLNKYVLHRWNPNKKEIVFNLSDSLHQEKNILYKKATYDVINNINKGLRVASAGIQIKIAEKSKESLNPGDIRNNFIMFIDEPLDNGLLGYAPTVANPRTGEILKGQVNMYPGVIKTQVEYFWSMMTLWQDGNKLDKILLSKTSETDKNQKSYRLKKEYLDQVINLKLKPITNSPTFLPAQLGSYKFNIQNEKIPSVGNTFESFLKKSSENLTLDSQLEIKESFNKINHKLNNLSNKNAFAAEFLTLPEMKGHILKTVEKIDGVKTKDGKLKKWKELTIEQKFKLVEYFSVFIYKHTLIHEFGHAIGLRHNFMGSYDGKNHYTDDEAKSIGIESKTQTSSVMEYSFNPLKDQAYFGKYDIETLRFGYDRKFISAKTNEEVRIKDTLKNAETENDFPNSYLYCTDQDVGSNALCARFDAGTNFSEITQFYINRYFDSYKWSNYRNNRDRFNNNNQRDRLVRTYQRFSNISKFFNIWKSNVSRLGLKIMQNGCNEKQASDPQTKSFCTFLSDIINSTKLAGEFFTVLIKTNNKSCVLEQGAGKLSLPLDYMISEWNLSPKTDSCFTEEAINQASNYGFIPRLEGGLFLNDIVNNEYSKDRNPLEVKGLWIDKMLAIEMLVRRAKTTISGFDSPFSLSDVNGVNQNYSDIVQNIIFGTKLDNPIPFENQEKENIIYNYNLLDDQIMLNGYTNSSIRNLFGLSRDGTSNYGKNIIYKIKESLNFDGDEFGKRFKNVKNLYDLRKVNLNNNDNISKDDKVYIGTDYKFIASPKNIFANNLIEILKIKLFGEEKLQAYLKYKIKKSEEEKDQEQDNKKIKRKNYEINFFKAVLNDFNQRLINNTAEENDNDNHDDSKTSTAEPKRPAVTLSELEIEALNSLKINFIIEVIQGKYPLSIEQYEDNLIMLSK